MSNLLQDWIGRTDDVNKAILDHRLVALEWVVVPLLVAVLVAGLLWWFKPLRRLGSMGKAGVTAGVVATKASIGGVGTLASLVPRSIAYMFGLSKNLELRQIVFKIQRAGLVGLAVMFSVALSIASFYTTYNGLLNFANSDLIALTAAIGMQGTLFIASWIVAHESALHANRRRRLIKLRREEAEDGEDERGFWRQAFSPLTGGLGYVAAHPFSVVMLITCLSISVFFSFDALFDQVYTEPSRLLTNRKVARSEIGNALSGLHATLVTERNKAAGTLVGSPEWVSFAKSIDSVAEASAAAKDAIEAANREERAKLETELGIARSKVDRAGQELALLQAQFNADVGASAQGVAAQADIARQEIIAATQRVTEAESKLAEAQRNVEDLRAQARDLKAKMDVEALAGGKGKGGKRRPRGQGPVWRSLNPQLIEVNVNLQQATNDLGQRTRDLATAKAALDTANRNAQTLDASKQSTKSKLDTKAGELASLKLALADLEKRYGQTVDTGTKADSPGNGALELVGNMLDAKRRFSGSGKRDDYRAMVDSCGHLVELLGHNAQTKKTIEASACQSTALSSNLQVFTALNDALDLFEEVPAGDPKPAVKAAQAKAEASAKAAELARSGSDPAAAAAARETAAQDERAFEMARATQTCAVDADFNSFQTIDEFVGRGRYCLNRVNLAPEKVVSERDTIDRVEQENSHGTSHFERTWSSLRRGDQLAWLALFIAFALDFLVLIAAILGERTLTTPLVSGGFVASKAELEDTVAQSYCDTTLYPDDPAHIRSYKIFIAHVSTEFVESSTAAAHHSIVDLNRADPNYAQSLAKSITAEATSDPPRAHALRRRPNVFRIENGLVQHYIREVGLYEKERYQLHGPRDQSLGEFVEPLVDRVPDRPDPGRRWDPTEDPFAPAEPIGEARPEPRTGDKPSTETRNDAQAAAADEDQTRHNVVYTEFSRRLKDEHRTPDVKSFW